MLNHTDYTVRKEEQKGKVSPFVAMAKIAAFVLPASIIFAVIRHHPDAGSVIGINVGVLCMYLVKPRRPSLFASLLFGVGLSAIYLLIMHINA
jgi:hypothetical protein